MKPGMKTQTEFGLTAMGVSPKGCLSQILWIHNICDMETHSYHERPKIKVYYRKKKARPRHCFHCGQSFEAIRCTAMLCSPRCRKAWNRRVKAGTWARHPNAVGERAE